jgi:predicted nucleotidyltransferase
MKKSDIIRKIVHYFEERPEVVAVYLFGSYAKGHEKHSSDIDLAVLVEHEIFTKEKDLAITYTVDLGRLSKKDFHISIMNNAGESVLDQVFRYGKIIFQQDYKALSHFKTFSYAMIADFSYQRSLMEKAFVSKLLGGSP